MTDISTLIITNTCLKIAIRYDGLHALAFNDSSGGTFIAQWTSLNDLVAYPVSTSLYCAMSTACEFMDDGTLIVGGMNMGGGPVVMNELKFDGTQYNVVHSYSFGDATNRFGAGCKTPDGGFACMSYCDTQPVNSIVVDVAYRQPNFPIPPDPKLVFVPWTTQRITMPSNTGSAMPMMISMCNDGTDVCAFFTRDSAGQLGFVRFNCQAGNTPIISVLDSNPFFIGSYGVMSISGEFPVPSAIHDDLHKRIIICCQSEDEAFTSCLTEIVSNHIRVLAVDDATHTPSLVLDIPTSSPHVTFPPNVAWPRPDGIYWNIGTQDNSACTQAWAQGFEGKQYLSNHQGARVYAWSDDGWVLFHNQDNTSELSKIWMKPTLTIDRSEKGFVTISWDNTGFGDQLQSSVDLKTWTNIPGATIPPVRLPAIGLQNNFRVYQSVKW